MEARTSIPRRLNRKRNMALPTFTMRQLLEAGVHFGHRTGRWNPKMAPYIFGKRNRIHVIDLQQTVPLLYRALEAVRDIVANGGRVLFVGTKRQASEKISETAKRCGQHYVNHRWLGGMMTNWKTISVSMRRLKELEERLAEENIGLTKKELLHLTRERDKLERALGGIKEMGGLPDILFVIDTNKESIAVHEAKKLGIPVVAVIDTNSDPEGITYPIPGNDDAVRSINLYCDLMSYAVLDGIQQEMLAAGIDVGEGEEAPAEQLAETEEEAPAAEGAAAPDAEQERPAAEPLVGPEAAPAGQVAAVETAEAATEPQAVEEPEPAPLAATGSEALEPPEPAKAEEAKRPEAAPAEVTEKEKPTEAPASEAEPTRKPEAKAAKAPAKRRRAGGLLGRLTGKRTVKTPAKAKKADATKKDSGKSAPSQKSRETKETKERKES